MEESFFNLTQVMQQRFMDPRNSRSTSTADNSFASLIVAELEALPEAEKRNRKQRILQILYELQCLIIRKKYILKHDYKEKMYFKMYFKNVF